MTTKKQRLQTFVDNNLAKLVRKSAKKNKVSIAQVIENILLAHYGSSSNQIVQSDLSKTIIEIESKVNQIDSFLINKFNYLDNSDSIIELSNDSFYDGVKELLNDSDISSVDTSDSDDDNIEDLRAKYKAMDKNSLFRLLTKNKIPHRIAKGKRLKRKEEIINDLLPSQ